MAAGTKQVTQLEFSVQIIYVAEEQWFQEEKSIARPSSAGHTWVSESKYHRKLNKQKKE
jgi:hypothetical protein